VPASKKEPGTWWSEPESSSASGGLISPADTAAIGPLDDALAPDPETVDPEPVTTTVDESPGQERTEVIPRRMGSRADRLDTPARARSRRRRSRPVLRRTKMTLRHVDPVSVLKLSLVFYGCVLVLWLVVVAFLYALLASAGIFDAIEKLGRTAVLWTGLDISLWFVERWALLIGVVLVFLGAIVNVFVAVVYNLASDVVGGAQMTFVERDI
jgi:Transmembrane domain of unknown function (DUF3566)